MIYYFSPDVMQIASKFIDSLGAVPCGPPLYPTIENHVTLSVGDAPIFELKNLLQA